MYTLQYEDYPNLDQLKPDFAYSFFQIHDYLSSHIGTQIQDFTSYFYDADSFIENLVFQINIYLKNNFLSFVLVHEYKIALHAEILEGTTDEEKFQNYIVLTNSEEWFAYVFEKYPLLQQRIENFITNSIAYLDHFFEHIFQDTTEIKDVLKIDALIHNVDLFLGDFHKGNQFVLKVNYLGTDPIYFKPRNFNNEFFFKETVTYFNTLGAGVSAVIPDALNKTNYSWVKHLNNTNEFETAEEIREFYYNQGKLLCLFQLLGTTDIIPDNLMVSDKTAGFFDLESLISKPRYLEKESIRYDFDESVLKVGMLPEWMINDNFERTLLSSVFFEFNSQKTVTQVWKSKKDYKFDYVESAENFSAAADAHLPKLNGEYVTITPGYLSAVLQGFTDLYQFVIQNKQLLCAYFASNKKIDTITYRVILHPTSIYSLIIREINIPEYLQGKKSVSEVLASLVELGTTDNFHFKDNDLMQSIERQINNLDVPYFYADVKKGVLYDGFGTSVSTDWKFDPVAYLCEKINGFNDRKLEFQKGIIDKTMHLGFEYFKKEFPTVPSMNTKNYFAVHSPDVENREVSTDKLLQAATRIGNYLNSILFEKNDTINWISKVRDPLDGRYHISLLDYDLYDGLSGVALFYIQLYEYSRQDNFKENALKIYNQLNTLSKVRNKECYYQELPVEMLEYYPISPYSYPASFIYLSTHIQDVFGDSYVAWETIELLLEDLLFLVNKNKNYEYLLGAAGLIDFLLQFREICPPHLVLKTKQLLDTALTLLTANGIYSGELASWPHVDEGQVLTLGGFAHGTAGISQVLFRAAAAYGDPELEKKAVSALGFDRSFFDSESKGWLDNRDNEVRSDSGAWCHGAGGIVLGRMLSGQYYTDAYLEDEIRIAQENLLKNGFHGNQCICHGDFGNLEILYAIAHRNSDAVLKNKVHDVLGKIVEESLRDVSFRYGDGGNMEILGLFVGLSGMGYQLLRFYDWKKVPSILCLETPKTLNSVVH